MRKGKLHYGLPAAAVAAAALLTGSSAAVAADKVVVIPLMRSAAGIIQRLLAGAAGMDVRRASRKNLPKKEEYRAAVKFFFCHE